MRLLIVIVFLVPVVLFAQSKKQKKRKQVNLSYMFMNIFGSDLDSAGFKGKTIVDTAYYPNKQIKSIGGFATYGENKKTNLRVGLWTEFYENGKTKSTGNYQLQYYLACRGAMPTMKYEEYKINEWVYYYVNGQVKAKGIYMIETKKAYSSVSGQFVKRSIVTNDWLFYEMDGKNAEDKDKLIAELDPRKLD